MSYGSRDWEGQTPQTVALVQSGIKKHSESRSFFEVDVASSVSGLCR